MHYALCQINPIVGDLKYNIQTIKKHVELSSRKNVDLAIFPELCLTGYPAEDLFLNKGFLKSCHSYLNELITWSTKVKSAFLIGMPLQEGNKIYNGAALIHQGSLISTVKKSNLPNYGVFDEQRIFSKSNKLEVLKFKRNKIGVLICEDMWSFNVANKLVKKGVDLFIVINSSPYDTDKKQQRLELAGKLVHKFKVPLLYINQIGGQDELVFDGGSFVLDASQKLILPPQQWKESAYYVNYASKKLSLNIKPHQHLSGIEDIYQALILGTRDYLSKNNFSKVLLGASGGIDSTLVAVIAADAIGAENVRLVRLPSQYSSAHSLEDAEELSKNLKTDITTIPIHTAFEHLLSILKDELKDFKQDITEENIQARIRGLILMALSNKHQELLLTTGNKSEYACGYATLYGDMCGGFAPLKDVYKTVVYKLAKWRNQNIPINSECRHINIIPKRSISKPPSAELKPGQLDQDTLPPYELLDEILYELIENDQTASEVIKKGFEEETVNYIAKLLLQSEYKRKQSTLGVKITPKMLGKDRRYPITNHYNLD